MCTVHPLIAADIFDGCNLSICSQTGMLAVIVRHLRCIHDFQRQLTLPDLFVIFLLTTISLYEIMKMDTGDICPLTSLADNLQLYGGVSL